VPNTIHNSELHLEPHSNRWQQAADVMRLRATTMAILPENRKMEYPKSVTELLRQEEKSFVQGIPYFVNKIPVFI
jgi:hypothetical protein